MEETIATAPLISSNTYPVPFRPPPHTQTMPILPNMAKIESKIALLFIFSKEAKNRKKVPNTKRAQEIKAMMIVSVERNSAKMSDLVATLKSAVMVSTMEGACFPKKLYSMVCSSLVSLGRNKANTITIEAMMEIRWQMVNFLPTFLEYISPWG